MANPFESGARKVIPATLIYARKDDRVLMLHRNARSVDQDIHSGKWNGLGGKLELDEDPLQGAKREFQEEAGWDLPLDRFKVLGVLQFPNFKPKKSEDWLVFVVVVDLEGIVVPVELRNSRKVEEGTLEWVECSRLLALNLWAGDREFIPKVLDGRPFVGTLKYKAGEERPRAWLQDL